MDPLAIDLNNKIKTSAPAVYDCLSEQGKAMFYPAGILSQSAEAKQNAHRYNATIGIATEKNEPMHLPVTRKYFNHLDPTEIYTYAPPGGKPKLRQLWKEKLVKTNLSLKGKNISNPMVTSALTNGLSIAADLFVDPKDIIVIPDKMWGVYRLNFVTRKGGEIANYPMFNKDNGFNTEGFAALLEEKGKTQRKLVTLLSFPNNPTGFTPSEEEVEKVCEILKAQAEKGTKIVVVCDDAYFGLFYEGCIKESIFGRVCDLHENILAVKLDGATKESYAWGFRTGFITFGNKTDKTDDLYYALEMKTQGIIRCTLSSCCHPSQSVVEKALQDPNYWVDLEEKYQIMFARVKTLKKVLEDSKYDAVWESYPFNSGYFMCLKLHKVDAEELRVYLLEKYGIGTISISSTDLRIAFSCVEKEDIADLFEAIYQAAIELEAS